MALIVDPDLLAQGVETTIDTGARTILLSLAGDLSADGITHQCVYSFWKEEWKTDSALSKFPFPIISIGPEQFEWTLGWKPADNATRKLIRNGGWKEVDLNGILQEEHTGVVTLGTFEDQTNDTAYYRSGNDPTLDDTTAMTYAGPVNEPVKVFEEIGNPPTCDFTTSSTITRASGSFITDGYKVGGQVVVRAATQSANDGSWTLTSVAALTITVSGTPFTTGVDTAAQLGWAIREEMSLYLRVRDADPKGKIFAKTTQSQIGFSILDNNTRRWGLTNSSDQKIDETDANISANSPYTQINIKYFDADFNMDIDTPSSPRAFGIVIDVGTHSGKDGTHTSGGSVLTSADGDIHTSNYDGGTLEIHDGANPATYTIVSTTATTITISGTFPATTPTDLSFTCQRSTPVVATIQEIYEKVQWSLRQTTDINYITSLGDVIGKVADELLTFIGDALKTGAAIPTNPNGGGSGVVILGFDANDTNSITFIDNTATEYTFPFVAAGTINFSPNLVADAGPAEYWMYFEYTTRTSVADLALSSPSGLTASLDSAGANLPTLSQNDYIYITGFSDSDNDGLYQVTDATPSATQADVTKVFPAINVTVETGAVRPLDQNPINSPDAIIVNDNSGSPIEGTIGASSAGFDFDYDNNVQGGRTAATNASVILRAIGHDQAQFIEATGTITRAVGLSFVLTSSLERNYNNP